MGGVREVLTGRKQVTNNGEIWGSFMKKEKPF